MASSINADNGVVSGSAGLKSTADSTGVLALQTNGTTAISIDASQAVSFTNAPTVTGGTANGVAYLNGSKVLTTGSALVFNGTNLGVGVTPSAWSLIKGLQVTGGGFFGSYLNNSYMGANWYFDGTNKYIASDFATEYEQNDGKHIWYTAPSGTAGNTITFTQAMTLDASGNLLVATTNANQNVRIGQKLGVVSTGSGTYGGVGISSYSGTSAAVAPVLDINRSRGTTDQSFTAVASGDYLGYIVFRGSDGTGFTDAAYIQGAVDGTVAANQVPARLVFSTANSAGTVTERARFNSTGAFVLAGGTTTANGIGITFPATQSASSDANTLDDYEEGTWTPALTGATFSTTAAGTYVKVGQVVTVWGYISFSYSSPTSTFYINNLPFTVYDNTNVRGGAGTVMCQSGVTFNNYVTIEPINASVVAYFENNISGSNRADMGSSNFASGGSVVRFTITYRTSA